jgi:hypothetical protein
MIRASQQNKCFFIIDFRSVFLGAIVLKTGAGLAGELR